MEVWTIGGVLASIGLIAVIATTQSLQLWAVKRQQDMYREEQTRQITMAEHQKNLDSARLVLEIDKEFRTDEFLPDNDVVMEIFHDLKQRLPP